MSSRGLGRRRSSLSHSLIVPWEERELRRKGYQEGQEMNVTLKGRGLAALLFVEQGVRNRKGGPGLPVQEERRHIAVRSTKLLSSYRNIEDRVGEMRRGISFGNRTHLERTLKGLLSNVNGRPRVVQSREGEQWGV